MSVARTVKLPDDEIVRGVGRNIPSPNCVSAVDRSVKIEFHVAERITSPGAAFCAPVGGVYTPEFENGKLLAPLVF